MQLQLYPDETIARVAADLRSGERTCVDVVEGCLQRIDEFEARIRAWVSVDREGALERARLLDGDRADGRWHGPLHGVPIGIKDIVDVAGCPTAAGSERLARETKHEDATLVARLRDAGAVILGKTVTTQFACFDPPPTRNPWNENHTPGGSSSGSAAAVAAGMCLAAIGSQTGGSITRPAAFCGIAGCKPTFGRVSRRGVFPLAGSLDHVGPLARSVTDLAIVLDAISGHDPRDPASADVPPTDLLRELDKPLSTNPKLGRLGGLFDDFDDRSARNAHHDALDRLQAGGATVVATTLPPSFERVLHCHRAVMLAELAAWHEHRLEEHPDDYRPGVRSLVEEGLAISAAEYVRCREHQQQLRREVTGRLRGGLARKRSATSTGGSPANPAAEGENCQSGGFGDVDVLVCPAATGPAPDTSTTGDPAFNAPWSYTGLPTVSFPIGLAANGLPLAVQLVGPPFAETKLFQVAAWCERVLRRS